MARYSYRLEVMPPLMAVENEGAARTYGAWTPHLDAFRDNHTLWLRLELAAVSASTCSVQFDGEKLHVEGQRSAPDFGAETRCVQSEIECGAFHRSIELPRQARIEAISATYQAGILLITVPLRADATTSRRIDVE